MLYKKLTERINKLLNFGELASLRGSLIGIEKESLRVGPDGKLAQTPHPATLGSSLTHPNITTDYSEALIEFITPPLANHEALGYLHDIQTFVVQQLDNEILWAGSMPCVVAGEGGIPIAQYGNSNLGMMKTVYRRGLGHRYGRVMQVISGVHFNYSLPDTVWPVYQQLENESGNLQNFVSTAYFSMTRNLQRFGWLVPYLFGASPAVCKSFLGGKTTSLLEYDSTTFYEPFATSLRMGDIGYQNSKEDHFGVKACYDSIEAYISCLTKAIEPPCPEYEKFNTLIDGEFQQLNANILQIENEYYSSVRPKQILNGNEKPTLALKRRGVKYIELRSLDINPIDPLGLNEEQLYFLEAFVIFCLLHESQPITAQERKEIDQNAMDTAHRGREPSLKLQKNGEAQTLASWAAELADEMQAVCEILDIANNTNMFSKSLNIQIGRINDPEKTPSAIMLAKMRENKEGFFHHLMRMSQTHYDQYKKFQLSNEQMQYFKATVTQSIQKQKELEASDQEPFDAFLKNYFAQK
jgi:glutamate--cysteine ligase